MISASDFAAAGDIKSELELVGIPAEMKPAVTLLSARLALGLGRGDQAAGDYAELAAGPESPAMAEARLRLVEMHMNRGDLDRPRAIEALETLSFVWRGDETEVETMRLLAKLYVGEARYRDAFNLLDAALQAQPESEVTRGFYSEMAAIFEDLFLSERASAIEPIEALAIYYDFSKLTPIGRRGDELIRRLAERLVSVDLLDQAAELLDYQVKYRLSGVAKAQVAAKLAWVQLLNAKPAAAIQALAATRIADIPQELREQRLLLEARALSELGRYNAALELAAGATGAEAERLRGDILWAAKRWREAGEAYEKLLGVRWQKPDPLDETERRDVLKAGIAFALGSETLGLTRLRDRYSAKMSEGAERTALGIIAMPSGNEKKLGDVAKALSAVDSLKLFLKLYQARFPDRPLPPDEADPKPQKVSAR
jgi:tetratricopeptide (TPR) repeat protein